MPFFFFKPTHVSLNCVQVNATNDSLRTQLSSYQVRACIVPKRWEREKESGGGGQIEIDELECKSAKFTPICHNPKAGARGWTQPWACVEGGLGEAQTAARCLECAVLDRLAGWPETESQTCNFPASQPPAMPLLLASASLPATRTVPWWLCALNELVYF